MSTEITVTLPDPTGWDDAETSDGSPGRVPLWSLEVVEGPSGVSAWDEGVAIDGDLHEGSTVDLIEADALALLAAVHTYRRNRAEGGEPDA